MLNNLLKKLTTKSTNVSEELSAWEIVDPTLTDSDTDENLYSSLTDHHVETKGACKSRESGFVLDDDVTLTQFDINDVGENEAEKKWKVADDVALFGKAVGENEVELVDDVTRFVSRKYEEEVEEEDVVKEDDDDDGGEDEDLMYWKLKGRFGKQNMGGKRAGTKKLPMMNKMPCYYHISPKTELQRRGKRLVR